MDSVIDWKTASVIDRDFSSDPFNRSDNPSFDPVDLADYDRSVLINSKKNPRLDGVFDNFSDNKVITLEDLDGNSPRNLTGSNLARSSHSDPTAKSEYIPESKEDEWDKLKETTLQNRQLTLQLKSSQHAVENMSKEIERLTGEVAALQNQLKYTRQDQKSNNNRRFHENV